jgi:hypothetical protein
LIISHLTSRSGDEWTGDVVIQPITAGSSKFVKCFDVFTGNDVAFVLTPAGAAVAAISKSKRALLCFILRFLIHRTVLLMCALLPAPEVQLSASAGISPYGAAMIRCDL